MLEMRTCGVCVVNNCTTASRVLLSGLSILAETCIIEGYGAAQLKEVNVATCCLLNPKGEKRYVHF